MQQFNREAYERKISQVYESVDLGDYKKAQRTIATLLEKAKSPIETLMIRVTKAYVLDRQTKRLDAVHEVDEVIQEITKQGIVDQMLID